MEAIMRLLVLLCWIAMGVWSLHNVKLVLPRVVRVGGDATLVCKYDLEGAPLYSVKWYRGSHEFYRYTPRESPPARVFPFQGITVDLATSTAKQVSLRNIPLHLSGIFSCEVSADAPSFSTKYVSDQLTVLEIPDTRPVMTVLNTAYREGEIFTVNCTTNPPRKLTFYINNIPVSSSLVKEWEGGAMLQTTLSMSQFSSRGELRLKCVASTMGLYNISSGSVAIWLDTNETVKTESPNSAENQQTLLVITWMSSCLLLWTR